MNKKVTYIIIIIVFGIIGKVIHDREIKAEKDRKEIQRVKAEKAEQAKNVKQPQKPKQIKLPPPPIKYEIIGQESMSRGDYSIVVKLKRGQTKAKVMALAKYFQHHGIKSKDSRIHKLTFKGGMRMITIKVPYPKGSKAKEKEMYVLQNDVRGIWL